jgi:hypothetical protein
MGSYRYSAENQERGLCCACEREFGSDADAIKWARRVCEIQQHKHCELRQKNRLIYETAAAPPIRPSA